MTFSTHPIDTWRTPLSPKEDPAQLFGSSIAAVNSDFAYGTVCPSQKVFSPFQSDCMNLFENAVSDYLPKAKFCRTPCTSHLRNNVSGGDPLTRVLTNVRNRRHNTIIMTMISERRFSPMYVENSEHRPGDTGTRMRNTPIQQFRRYVACTMKIWRNARKLRRRTITERVIIINTQDCHVIRYFKPDRFRTRKHINANCVIRRKNSEWTRRGLQPIAQHLAIAYRSFYRTMRVKGQTNSTGIPYAHIKCMATVIAPID